ncbi:MAG: DUF6279 family lipoprotein [Pseudomonadota bacterium]
MKKFNTRGQGFWQACCLLLLVLTLGACSTIRFTYNHGDTLLYWWIDAYLDLDSDQTGWVKRDIDELFQWHRKTQLRDYTALLINGQKQLAGNMSQADLLADFNDIKARTQLLLFKSLPELADLARSVRPEQIARMEKKFKENNEDYRKKFMKGDLEKRQRVRYQKSMDQFELWFGSFSRDQEAILRKASDARPLDNEIWLDERIRRQQRILAMLHKVQQEKLGKDATIALIHAIVKDSFERLDAPERKAFFDAYIDSTAKFVLTAVKIATPEQKAHAHKRMQGWIDDFNSLAAAAK